MSSVINRNIQPLSRNNSHQNLDYNRSSYPTYDQFYPIQTEENFGIENNVASRTDFQNLNGSELRNEQFTNRSNAASRNFINELNYNPSVKSVNQANYNGQFVSSQVTNQEVIKGNSRVEYVPYEKKIIEYENRQYIEKVPVKRKVIEYEERREIESVPREVIKQDYYAVERITQYFKEIVPEKKIEMVQVPKTVKRYEYVPVEK